MKIILIIYVVILAVWVIGSGLAIYHNFVYEQPGSKMRLAFYIYLAASAMILLFSFYMLYPVDWSAPIKINF